MKYAAALACALFFCADAYAAAPHEGGYVQASGFVTKMRDQEVTITGFGSGTLDYNTGYGMGASLGYAHHSGLRAEAEATYRNNVTEDFGDDEDFDSLALMANLYYDFKNTGLAVVPYVGAGLGAAQIDPSMNMADDGINVFAYQFMAGVSYPFNDRVSGTLGYRYFATDKIEETLFPGVRISANYETHNAELGMRVGF